jgi:hypothetical protein
LTTANAEVVFAREKDLKIVSGQSQSGLIHHTSIVASDPKSASVHKVGIFDYLQNTRLTLFRSTK